MLGLDYYGTKQSVTNRIYYFLNNLEVEVMEDDDDKDKVECVDKEEAAISKDDARSNEDTTRDVSKIIHAHSISEARERNVESLALEFRTECDNIIMEITAENSKDEDMDIDLKRLKNIEHRDVKELINTYQPAKNKAVDDNEKIILTIEEPIYQYPPILPIPNKIERSIGNGVTCILGKIKESRKMKEDLLIKKLIEKEALLSQNRKEVRTRSKQQLLVQDVSRKGYSLRRRKARQRTQFGTRLKVVQRKYLAPEIVKVKPSESWECDVEKLVYTRNRLELLHAPSS